MFASTSRIGFVGLSMALVGAACGEGQQERGGIAVLLPSTDGDGSCHPGETCSVDFGIVRDRAQVVAQLVSFSRAEATLASELVGSAGVFTATPPGSLAGDTSAAFIIEAVASEFGERRATLQVKTDFGESISVNLLAVLEPSQRLVIEAGCNFGQVPVGQTSDPCLIHVSNPSAVEVEVADLAIAGAPFAPSTALVLPLLLAPQEAVDFGVVAAPLRAGVVGGTFSANTADGGVFSVSLAVEGVR